MSWGYWGILAGVMTLLAVFFVCMELLYAGARGTGRGKGSGSDESRDEKPTAASDAKHAA